MNVVTRDLVAAGVIFSFSAFVVVQGLSYPAGAGLFPAAIAGVMMLLSVALAVRTVVQSSTGAERQTIHPRVIVVAVLTVFYVIGVASLGFITATIIFIPATAYCLGYRNHVAIFATAIVAAGLCYFVFKGIFFAPLPDELIMRLFA